MFWTSGRLHCVLICRRPSCCEVQVFNDDRVFLTERCDDPDEAAAVAERLWRRFVEADA